MITAAEYRQLRKEFMEKYDLAVRNWLINVKNCDKAIVDEIPLFKDGVVCPEKWVENKTFRPLFIMKEPSTGLESDENTVLNDLKNYKKEWCRNEFDLVEDKFDDIQIGNSGTWMRVAKLTRALKETLDGEYTGCDNYDFRFVESVEENPLYHKLSTDQKEKYRYRTANENYKNEIERIAVLNIKKLGSGKKTTSKLSEIGKNFSLYIKDGEVGDLIYRQISDIIKPTIIIFCGNDGGKSIKSFFDMDKMPADVCLIEAYHPSYYFKSDVDHCSKVVAQYEKWLNKLND